MMRSNSQPLGYKSSALAIEVNNSKAIAGKELSLSSWCIESFDVFNFSTVVDLSSEKKEIYSENDDDGTRTSNPSVINRVLSEKLERYCREGTEFIQVVYCIIIHLSFFNSGGFFIREAQWFYWTQELLVLVQKFTVRMPINGLELATPRL